MADKNEKLLVAAIDFGITFSGYAFSLTHEYRKDPLKISTRTWTTGCGSCLSLKAPTCVLLSPQQEFMAFGYEAEDLYAKLVFEEKQFDYYFFEGFKMSLYVTRSAQKLSKNILIKDNKGKEVPALDLFAHVIRYLKSHLLNYLDSSLEVSEIDRKIHWVLPVPGIWKNSARQLMREAANKAGILTEQLTICLDPEAASLYCQYLHASDVRNNLGNCSFRSFRAGTKYMIIDLGGMTVEVNIYLKKSDGTLEELHRPTGGLWGSTKINEAFERMMIKIFGSRIFEEMKDNHRYEYIDICRDFETLKRGIKPDFKEKVTLRLPFFLFKEFAKEKGGESIKKAITQTEYGSKINIFGDKLRMHADLLKDLFTEPVDMIVKHLKELMTKDISTILMVGEFSESPMMHKAIMVAFPDKKVIVPADAGYAVLNGAVLFGHESGAVPQSIPPDLL